MTENTDAAAEATTDEHGAAGREDVNENEGISLALAQLAVEAGDLEGNRDRAVDAIERAAARGADLVALPELFTVGYFEFDLYARSAEPLEGETLGRLRDAAIENDVAVLTGSFVEDLAATDSVETPADEGYANTTALLSASGNLELVYRKHHLFGYESAETELLVPGEAIETATVCGLTVGVSTCYDLRFPELYRRLVDQGVELILVPSAWPYPRLEHWQTLSRARAIENQCYVATINGSGSFEEASLLGRSTVYDPWGTVLASSGDDPALVMADVDAGTVSEVRSRFPALRDRRL
ncbi:carbon-nitrogen family hydrolase [Natronosalvus rutilus]|uniref:Carbon-nitrogen family hydrolase n=1 Tax=Natronosalvus rutilus TaxID=2953753 RepID=A0A9E7NAD8_9EURY|nr:carbon-nitrogen family hydrolase [Natronosalvus rutilus]UTF53283.1 carbon-nitrogen family hydrolase [Natronosalvus rutilus]